MRTDNKGFTIVEIMVVVTIISILLIAMGIEFVGWKGKYAAESEIKTMYIDLVKAKSRAMQTKIVHFVEIPNGGSNYKIYEDSSPAPDGNGSLSEASDTLTLDTSSVLFIYDVNISSFGFTRSGMAYDSNGIIESPKYIRIVRPDAEDINADYDCLEIISTRINTGLWDGVKCEAK